MLLHFKMKITTEIFWRDSHWIPFGKKLWFYNWRNVQEISTFSVYFTHYGSPAHPRPVVHNTPNAATIKYNSLGCSGLQP